ncbi:hypothetical protein PBI_GRAYSON_185 [Rhodococcus phage Grayson]|nr:hypothetical protein PBI_GRAYSON_185 [Rhodococcus phage Grayson]
MVAALEQRGETASMFSRREVPWHNLGQIVPDDITSTEDVLKLAKLDNWNIRLEPFVKLLHEGYSTHINKFMVVRDNPWYEHLAASEADENGEDYPESPHNVLGIVGSRFEDLSNEAMAEFAEKLLKGGRWETAGSIEHGTRVFMSMALDAEIIIDENGVHEKIESYLVLSNAHNGTGHLSASVTNIRPVCKNTLDWGLQNATQRFDIRHTKSMKDRMAEAERVLNLSTNYNEEFMVSGQALFEAPVTDAEFFDIIATVYPEPDNGKTSSLNRWNAKVDDIMAIWESDTIEGIKNTGWGALNTLEEEMQWNRGVYKEDTEAFWVAGAGLDKLVQKDKTELFQTVSGMVLV